ncbi:putative plasmid stabilization system protein [Gregarina niphandrodes]|uniref:Plasmid stabilization system protein n=1 Tax=Gregarina niphandrodes TaxID=110365 RepID=A0A023B8S9_GRENI|nr:putative plasmid stabilization system protein [Gregarina niphandrodes]EZG70155.1 putative plasmid stabilization system protein [Gregarina niphandrodes]|eukprot:XP_011129974.1 putative plasmid stabilization system protein [Gregarina niphandrodes]
MARGSKDKYSDKQKRQAEHIYDSYRDRYGTDEKRAAGIAWATVNKYWGGGMKGGSGSDPKASKVKEEKPKTRRRVKKEQTPSDEE